MNGARTTAHARRACATSATPRPASRAGAHGKGFRYRHADGGAPCATRRTLARIRALAIPPAWTDVWICPRRDGHIQATGRDARGRKQYRYHPRWREVRDETKYGRHDRLRPRRCRASARRVDARPRAAGPAAREGARHRRAPARDDAASASATRSTRAQNDSFGLTTLRDRHVRGQRLERCASSSAARAASQHDVDAARPPPRAHRAALPGPARPGAVPVRRRGRRAARASTRPTSTPTCARSPARTSPPRTSAPGPAPCWPRGRCTSSRPSTPRPQAKQNVVAGDRGGGRAARQHAGRLPQVLHPSRDPRELPRGRARRCHAARRAGKAAEKAVAALLEARARRAAAAARRSGAEGRSLVPALARSLGTGHADCSATDQFCGERNVIIMKPQILGIAFLRPERRGTPKSSPVRASSPTNSSGVGGNVGPRPLLPRRPRPVRAPTRPATGHQPAHSRNQCRHERRDGGPAPRPLERPLRHADWTGTNAVHA